MKKDLGGRLSVKDTCSITLHFLTNNRHKFMEVKLIARKYSICLKQLRGCKLEIQSSDLGEIAKYALLEAYRNYKKPLMVEDAGLFIKALGGFPGPYSSYVYKTIGLNGILKLMESVVNREAYFMSVIALIYEPYIIIEKAVVYGEISLEPRGDKGFGYDPIFIPKGSPRTFAEMDTVEKNMYSHRGKAVEKAFSKLVKMVKTYNTR